MQGTLFFKCWSAEDLLFDDVSNRARQEVSCRRARRDWAGSKPDRVLSIGPLSLLFSSISRFLLFEENKLSRV
jgi:hypothetical protein